MKIAQITNIFPPYKAGMGQVPFHLASELYRLGEEVEVITPDYGKGREEFDFRVKYLKPVFKWGLGAFCPQIIFQLNKYDVVKLHYPAYGVAEMVWLWKIIFGRKKKFFIFYHMDNVGAGVLGFVFNFYKNFITPMILKSADKIQVSSFDYAENSDIKNFYHKNKQKFIQLPFGVTADYHSGQGNLELLQKFNIDHNKKIILFVGGLRREHYFKGVDYLLKALANLKFDNWHFVAIGKGELIIKYRALAHKLGILDKVTFTGYQADEVMPDWFRQATTTVLPSIDKSEAFGVVLVEAQGCGCPVIASDLPGVRTTLENGKTGFLVRPKDVNDLVEKLSLILENDSLQQEMSIRAAERIKEKYLWSEIGKKLLKIYKS